MTLHPDIIDAMVAAGATAQVIAAACRAAWNLDTRSQSETVEGRPAGNLAGRPGEAGVGYRRADGDDGVVGDLSSSGTLAPLSLSKDPLSLSFMAVDSGNSGDNRHALPLGFQPDQKTKAFVIKQVGEASAEAIVSSFRDYFWARPVERETAAGWQQRLRAWAKREKGYPRGPPQLPLMRPIAGGQAWETRRESG